MMIEYIFRCVRRIILHEHSYFSEKTRRKNFFGEMAKNQNLSAGGAGAGRMVFVHMIKNKTKCFLNGNKE